MADLSLPPWPASRGDRSRGQIILIAAFALAVAFVALALVTNSAIFAENLASRGETSGTADAAAYQYEVRQNIGAAMEYANWYNNTDHPTAVIALNKSVVNQSGKLADQRAVNSRVTSVEDIETQNGTIIRQTSNGSFTNATGVSGWSLVKNFGGTRAFTMTITDHKQLETTGGPDPFTVYVEDHDDTNTTSWEMTLAYEDTGGAENVVLEVDSPTIPSGTSAKCEVLDVNGPVTVDVTGARLNGTYCAPLEYYDGDPSHFAAGLTGPYNVSYQNGGKIKGNYSLVVNNSTLSKNTGLQTNYNPSGGPEVDAAVYAAKVDLNYSTESLTYESRIRVAPGEPE